MSKHKKRKLRIGRLFFVLIIIGLISFLCIKLFEIPIMSVQISGNKMLTDDEVLSAAKIDNYPSFLGTLMISIKRNLKKNSYVEDARVKKGLLNVKITVKEKKILYIKKDSSEKVTLNGTIKDEKTACVPILTNDVPTDKVEGFNKAMNKISNNVLCQMSEIKYDPNDIDSDRYFVNMNDGNNVYLTVNKFNKLNKYNKILENVGKQNGILYLDYGDYFEVK